MLGIVSASSAPYVQSGEQQRDEEEARWAAAYEDAAGCAVSYVRKSEEQQRRDDEGNWAAFEAGNNSPVILGRVGVGGKQLREKQQPEVDLARMKREAREAAAAERRGGPRRRFDWRREFVGPCCCVAVLCFWAPMLAFFAAANELPTCERQLALHLQIYAVSLVGLFALATVVGFVGAVCQSSGDLVWAGVVCCGSLGFGLQLYMFLAVVKDTTDYNCYDPDSPHQHDINPRKLLLWLIVLFGMPCFVCAVIPVITLLRYLLASVGIFLTVLPGRRY